MCGLRLERLAQNRATRHGTETGGGAPALPVPCLQQLCSFSCSLRLEINLEDFELVIHDRHVSVQRPYAAIGQTRQLELVGLMPGFTGAHPAVARWFDHVRYLEAFIDRLALKKLMLPDGGMGDTFKVLIQAKGVENPRLLCMRDWGEGF